MRAFKLELTPEQRELIRSASGQDDSPLWLELKASRDGEPLTFHTASQCRLGGFLLSLALNPAKLRGFLRDPEGALKAEELSDAEKTILCSRNSIQIHEAVQRERPLALFAPRGLAPAATRASGGAAVACGAKNPAKGT
jgi:hypothetical protein